jgi:hypothetical protein
MLPNNLSQVKVMLRKLLICSVLWILASTASQASSFLSQSLKLKDVYQLSVTEEPNAKLCSLHIRGLAGHSALMIERTIVEKVGRIIHVNVELTLARDGGSGNFDVATIIDTSIDEVVFGKENAVVWKRENSKCLSQKH